MFDSDSLKEIWQTITRNKGRSLLTAFGVFWGIFILVVLMSAGRGIESGLHSALEGFATNSAFVLTRPTTIEHKGYPVGHYWNLTYQDLKVLHERVPELQNIVPVIFMWGGDNQHNNTVYKDNRNNFGLRGTTPEYNNVDRCFVLQGRYLNQTDINTIRKVCVIGEQVATAMFEGENPIDKLLKINGVYFQVVGVVRAVNSSIQINGDNNKIIVLPISTMQSMYNRGDNIDCAFIACDDTHPITQYTGKIATILKARHNISPNDDRAMEIYNFYEQFKIFNNLFLGLNLLIWIVGLGTLLSGVVGVSNIMLVTVKERTCEIGIRRALGAKPGQIARQILSESVVLTCLAGLAGLCAGTWFMALISPIIMNLAGNLHITTDAYISFNMAIVATLIIIASGLLAGWLPVKRALRIKAIDAIRDE